MRCCCCKPAQLPDEVYTNKGSILWSDQDIPGALVLRNFSSPQKYASYNYRGISAAMAVTTTHWLCYTSTPKSTSSPMIRVEWSDARISNMKLSVVKNQKQQQARLVIHWDANLFQSTWKGSMELRLKVDDPQACLQLIQERIATAQGGGGKEEEAEHHVVETQS